ncbi:MAG: alpha-2-macroglobulin family protein [Planctomycetota bacterium]
MRRMPSRFGLLSVILIALNVVGLFWIRDALLHAHRPRFRVLAASPARQVDDADRFELRFDAPVARPSEIGERPARALFEIEPEPAGHWRWAEADRLEYLLENRLPLGREYVIRPAAHLEAETGRILVGTSEFRFRTSALELRSCEVRSSDHVYVRLELRFNQLVDPVALLRHLEVYDGGDISGANVRHHKGKIEIHSLTQAPALDIVVRVNRPQSHRLVVKVLRDLTGHGAHLGLVETSVQTLDVLRDFRLENAYVPTPGADDAVEVRLQFSAFFSEKVDPPTVEVRPQVADLRVRRSGSELCLTGAFQCGARYTAIVDRNAVSADGRPLGREQTIAFNIPDRAPTVDLAVRHGILMPTGNLSLDLRLVNVAALGLEAWRLYENNLVAHLQGNARDETSRQVMHRTIALGLQRNVPSTVAIDLRQLLGEVPTGVYALTARARNRHWARDDAVVAVTDIALTTKRERDGYLVWATSLATAAPIANATISALTYTNQVIATATTAADGVARLRVPKNSADDHVWLIAARLAEDLSFIQPDRRPWVSDAVEQSGRSSPTAYDVALFTERGVYRPGDVIHLSGIVREPDGALPPALPLTIRVLRPDGKAAHELPVDARPDQQGFFTIAIPTTTDSRTGPYRFVASVRGAEAALGETSALVEAFVTVRIELDAAMSQEKYCYGEGPPTLAVAGRYLFGQPAADLQLAVPGTYAWRRYESRRFPEYQFDDATRCAHGQLTTIETRLDKDGAATVALSLPPQLAAGVWQASLTATVTEAGGRSVSRHCVTTIDTAEYHIGLRIPKHTFAPVGLPIDIPWVVVTSNDAPAESTKLAFELTRVEFESVLEEVQRKLKWKSVERLVPIQEFEFAQSASGSISIACPSAGYYRLTAVEQRTGQRARVEFYAASQSHDIQSFSLAEPERLEILCDQERYRPGELANIVVRAPSAGTMLLTIESDHVVEHRVVTMTTNTATVCMPVDTALRGSAFISATVVRAVDPKQGSWLPHRSRGMARLRIDHSDARPELVIRAPSRVEPGARIRVEVEAPAAKSSTRAAVVQLWAVDEGILLTTDYRTPDPGAHFFAPRKSEIASADLFSELLPDHLRPESMARIGADRGAAETLRRGTGNDRQRRESAVIWCELATLDAEGCAAFDLELPNMTGRLRVMAVFVDQDTYASAEHDVTLSAPLLVEASWPRYLVTGDSFQAPVKLFNSTDSVLEAELEFDFTGPLEIKVPTSARRVRVAPNEPAVVWLDARAVGIGPATVRVRAVAEANATHPEFVAVAETDLPVRSAAVLHSEVELLRLRAGESRRFAASSAFLPAGSGRVTLSISTEPQVELLPAITQLLDYPYGCLEQTTSRLLAILHAPKLLDRALPGDARVDSAGKKIESGIDRLWSMQTRDGGLGYWPGDNNSHLWGTAYAAEFLARASHEQFTIEPRFLDDLLKYLKLELDRRNDNDADVVDANLRAHLCYVLAAFDMPPVAWLERLAEQVAELDIAGRAHLAGAFAASGRADRAIAILPTGTINTVVGTTTSGRITSQVQQEAALLHVLLDIDVQHVWIPRLVERLYAARKNGWWGTTLATATAMAALARYQLSTPRIASEFTGEVVARGGRTERFDHRAAAHLGFDFNDLPLELKSAGSGTLYVVAAIEGDGTPELAAPFDRNFAVRRHWRARNGAVIDPGKLRIGDLVDVEIEVKATARPDLRGVDNIAIVDLLPAGLEVVNPRLASSGMATHSVARADCVEFLEDRVVIFASEVGASSTFRYALRATAVGSFAVPLVTASCMYDPVIASAHGAGRVEVAP